MHFAPFDALVPDPELASEIISPPYDVMDTIEAARMAYDKAHSLLQVTRSEIAFPPGHDPYGAEVYEKARDTLQSLVADGHLKPSGRPIYGVYRLTRGDHQQTGLVGLASVTQYRDNLVKKHEFTRPEKEDDRTRHIHVTGAQTGPVFLACRASAAFSAALDAITTSRRPEVDVLAPDGIRHEAWWVNDTPAFERLVTDMDAFYICDGHHRAASAARVAALEAANPVAQGFLAVLFSAEQLAILPYNRIVSDLNGLSSEEFFAALKTGFHVTGPGSDASPPGRHRFSMYLDGEWYGLAVRPELFAAIDQNDPVIGLDVAILQDHVLQPILGINDPRRDKRVDFVGGIRGTGELELRVDENGQGVAFSMFPTSLEELFRVADRNEVMPPKSTWFEPKLADGMFIHRFR